MRRSLTHCFCRHTSEPPVASDVQRSCESLLPMRGFDRCFCLERGFFGGQHETSLYPGQTHAGIVSQPEVLCGPAAFWTHYLRSFWSPHCAHLCLGETESARWDISPSMLFISRVLWSPCHSVSHRAFFFFCCWFLASLGLDGLDSGESSAKPLIWITSLSQWGR